MNREQIIQMARDAGLVFNEEYGTNIAVKMYRDRVERFAAAIRSATKDEDAKICASIAEQTVMSDNYQAKECESCIRASK